MKFIEEFSFFHSKGSRIRSPGAGFVRFCLHACLFVFRMPFCLLVCLSFTSLVCVSVWLFIFFEGLLASFVRICLLMCLLSVCLSVCSFICLSICLFVCLSSYLSVYLCVCSFSFFLLAGLVRFCLHSVSFVCCFVCSVICLSARLTVIQPTYLCICVTVHSLVCLFSVYVPFPLSAPVLAHPALCLGVPSRVTIQELWNSVCIFFILLLHFHACGS